MTTMLTLGKCSICIGCFIGKGLPPNGSGVAGLNTGSVNIVRSLVFIRKDAWPYHVYVPFLILLFSNFLEGRGLVGFLSSGGKK